MRTPSISLTPLTRHFSYCSDKLSRLAPPAESVERHSSCGIRSLAEGGNMAPILLRRLAFDLPSNRHRIELFPHSSRWRRVKEDNTRRLRCLDALRLYIPRFVPSSMEVLWMNTEVLWVDTGILWVDTEVLWVDSLSFLCSAS